jgi:hypothetical protein
MSNPNAELTTADLAAWCYPRLVGEPLRKHRWAIVRAALRVATRVRRDRPGGVVFRAKVVERDQPLNGENALRADQAKLITG